jgi:DNA-binding GntR family transcriptional regulator
MLGKLGARDLVLYLIYKIIDSGASMGFLPRADRKADDTNPCGKESQVRSKPAGKTQQPQAMPASPPRPEPRPLAVQAVDYIRDLIIQDILRPGERIPMQRLAAELGISLTPLREACKTLAAQRLVDLLPNRGAAVAAPSPDEVREMLAVYGDLEALGGRLAAENALPVDIMRIRELEREMTAAFRKGDRLAYFRKNQKFHLAIIEASHNRTLIEVHRDINARLYRIRFRGILASQRWRTIAGQHAGIVAAIAAGKAKLAGELLLRHLDGARVMVQETVPAVEPQSRRRRPAAPASLPAFSSD